MLHPDVLTTHDGAAIAPRPRIVAIDALRGFIMFWIVGGDAFMAALAKAMPDGMVQSLAWQLSHRPWEGVNFYDLIFPSFIFVVGVSLVFSLGQTIAHAGRWVALRRLVCRSALLFLLGLLVYGGLAKGWNQVRWVGVLQRIALCYLVAGASFTVLRLRGLVALLAFLLISYWVAMTFVPFREFNVEAKHLVQASVMSGGRSPAELFAETRSYVSGRFEDGLNVAQHLDFQYLPGKRWDGAYDPEGILSTAPAIATCLLGVLAGLLLRSPEVSGRRKVCFLIAAGLAGIVLGELWGLQFPVIKKIWTSSFVLVAGGWSALFLAFFYYLIDVRGWVRWCLPLRWFGMNSIAIYLVYHLVSFRELAERMVGGPVKSLLGPWSDLLITAVVLLMVTALVRELYRRKVFLKL